MTRNNSVHGDSDVEQAIGAESLDDLDAGEQRRRALTQDGLADREMLLRSLGDSDWRVRRFAARLAGDARETVSAHELIGFLDSEDAGVRNAAMKALIRMGARALDDLHDALSHEHADVRNFAAVCLGNIGHCSSTMIMIEALEKEQDENVRYMIVEALGRVGDVRACETLERLVDGHEHVAAAAVTALADIGSLNAVEHLIPMLSDPYLGGLAADALSRLPDGRALPALVRQAVRSSGGTRLFVGAIARTLEQVEQRAPGLVNATREMVDAEDRAALTELLVPSLLSADLDEAKAGLCVSLWLAQPELAAPALVAYEHLGTANCTVDIDSNAPFMRAVLDEVKRGGKLDARLAVLEHLIAHPQPGTAAALMDLAEAREPTVAVEALRALVATGETVPVKRLSHLWNSPQTEVRHESARALGRMRPSGSARVIDNAARSHDAEQALCASIALASALRPIRGTTLRGTVKILATHPDPAVRAHLARAMGVGTEGSLAHDTLLALSRDTSPIVRRAVASAMRSCTRPEQRDRLRVLASDLDPDVRRAAIHSLGCTNADRRDADVIGAAMEDDDPRVVVAAIEAVGRCKRLLSAPSALLRLVNSEDPDIAAEAMRALSKLDPLLGASTAEKLWSDTLPWRLRSELMLAMSKASVENALACAASALEDSDPGVRVAAVEIVAAQCNAHSALLLLTLLGDPELRKPAVNALHEFGPVAIGPLSQVSRAAGGQRCIDAAWLLGSISGAQVDAAISALLEDPTPELRWRGLIGLIRHGIAGFESRLEQMGDSDPDETCAAMSYTILGQQGRTVLR